MSERATICAWIELFIEELERVVDAAEPGDDDPVLAGELHGARTILHAIQTGQYLIDLAGGEPH